MRKNLNTHTYLLKYIYAFNKIHIHILITLHAYFTYSLSQKDFSSNSRSLFLPLPKPSIIRPYTHTEDETLDAVAQDVLHAPEKRIYDQQDEHEHHPGYKNGNKEGFYFIHINLK